MSDLSILSKRLLRINQVLALVPVGRSSWWEGCRTGRYSPMSAKPKTLKRSWPRSRKFRKRQCSATRLCWKQPKK